MIPYLNAIDLQIPSVAIVTKVEATELSKIAMSQVKSIHFIICLVWVRVFLAITDAHLETLIVKVKHDDEIIELHLEPKDAIVANEHLPVWTAHKGQAPHLLPNVMAEVGEFVMYQDTKRTAAVVLIKAHNMIYGVIDTRFIILGLPFDKLTPNSYHTVGGEYIKVRKENAEIKHLRKDYDALLSALMSADEIEYVNSLISSANTAQQIQSHPWTRNVTYEMSSSSSVEMIPLNEYQHVQCSYENYQQPWDFSQSQVPADHIVEYETPAPYLAPPNLFYPGILTDNVVRYIEPPTHNDPHSANKQPKVIQVAENQVVVDHESTPDTLYPEILVFVTHDVYEKNVNLNSPDEVAALVHQYLIYFNAIDMLFAKLETRGISMHINIAGLVIEAEPETFPYTYVQGTSNQIDVIETMTDFMKYIRRYRRIFSKDFFDFFFLSTSQELYNEDKKVAGVARIPFDIYKTRQKNKPHHVLGVIVRYGRAIGSYIGGAHEIAHLMNINHDPPNEKFKFCGTDIDVSICNAIMQEEDEFCQHCADWSEQSIKQFRKFASTNRNRCFLLNYPRSLNPYNHPIKMLLLHDQCSCYGFRQHYMDPLRLTKSCTDPSNCGRFTATKSILPLDGTPCAQTKVCWRKQCLDTGARVYDDKKDPIKENQPPTSPMHSGTVC